MQVLISGHLLKKKKRTRKQKMHLGKKRTKDLGPFYLDFEIFSGRAQILIQLALDWRKLEQ